MHNATPCFSRAAALAAILALCGCAAPRVVAPTSAAEVGQMRPGILNGYLDPKTLPDSLALLPAPPAPGSAAQAADEAAYQELTRFQGTPRGAIAVRDADLRFPTAPNNFSCALGIAISEQDTPNLNMLLKRSFTDAGLSTYKAKDKYQRTRPFVVHKTRSCTPASDAALAKDGSYPSGHTTIGWTWALLLTEIAPERSDALLQRGRAFGQSRGIRGAHWKSDIDAGRVMGAAVAARLHADPVFLAQMTAARSEIEQARSRGAAPTTDCAAEAAALSDTALIAP
ncbi:MAG TPA: phosphatase PAP2 family protein [Variovorax sp.]|jgi:acid phosphatase (class A)